MTTLSSNETRHKSIDRLQFYWHLWGWAIGAEIGRLIWVQCFGNIRQILCWILYFMNIQWSDLSNIGVICWNLLVFVVALARQFWTISSSRRSLLADLQITIICYYFLSFSSAADRWLIKVDIALDQWVLWLWMCPTRASSVAGPKVWNSLPNSVRLSMFYVTQV